MMNSMNHSTIMNNAMELFYQLTQDEIMKIYNWTYAEGSKNIDI